MRPIVLLTLLLVGAHAWAQQDVGLVSLVSGEVTFAEASGSPANAKPFMKVREGDRFDVPAGAQLRLVYFSGAIQERWQGPAALRAAKGGSAPLAGKPAEVTRLPASAPQRLARIPELAQNAVFGGVTVRGAKPPGTANVETDRSVEEARASYARLRREAAADDITPELFLFAALSDARRFADLALLAEDMLRRQPASAEVKSLAAWAKAQASR